MSPKTQKSLRNLVRTNKLIDYRKGHFLSVTHHTVPSQWQLRVMRDDCIFSLLLPFLLLCSFFQTNLPLTIGTSTPSLNALLYALYADVPSCWYFLLPLLPPPPKDEKMAANDSVGFAMSAQDFAFLNMSSICESETPLDVIYCNPTVVSM